MSQEDHNAKRRKYQQISERERYQLEGYLKAKMGISQIARVMGRDRRTIQREIVKGKRLQRNSDLTEKRVYLADAGQRTKEENGSMKGRGLKIGACHDLAKYLQEKIVKEKYSPYAAIESAKAQQERFETMVCYKTVYNYIDNEIFANISNKDLPVKREQKRGYHRIRKVALKNLKGRSIEDRPAQVNNREEEGHWEMDCVVGPIGSKACLLVLTERKSRQELIFKMGEKTQANVALILKRLEKKLGAAFKERFKSITMDNGVEFLDSAGVEGSVLEEGAKRTAAYYAHPYSSYERGSNENANKMIRRFIPKGSEISQFTDAQVQQIEYWMNHYPRRLFAGKSAHDMAAFGVTA